MIVARAGHLASRLVAHARNEQMIFEMATDVRQIDGDGDAERSKVVSRADARQHQEAWGINGPSAEQDLNVGPHDTIGNPQSDTPLVLDDQTEHLCANQQIHGHAVEACKVGGRGIVSKVPFDAELVPADTSGICSSKIRRCRESEVLRRCHEGRCDRIAVRHIRQREHVQRTIAAVPGAGATGKCFGALEIWQKVRVTPSLGPAIVRGRMAALIGEGVDSARTSHHFAARIRNDTPSEPRLSDRRISPVHLAALKLRPVRRIGNGG